METKTENDRHNLAIVGFGGMGTHHSNLLEAVDSITVKGVYDIREERLKAAQDKGYRAYGSLEELLADEQIDIVLVATPNDVHKDISIYALKAGKNVICEKPVTVNSSELEEILEAADETGKAFMVHQNRRWDQDYLTVKKIYDENIIGDVFHIESRMHGSRGIPGDWRRLKKHGGGMLLDWGIHLADRLLMLIDSPVKKVYCQMFFPTGQEVDESFILQLTFGNGKTVLIDVGTCNYIGLPLWYVCGTSGTAVIYDWDINGKIIKLTDASGSDVKPIVAGAGLTKTMATRKDDTIREIDLPIVGSDVTDFYRNMVDVIEGKAEPIIKNKEVLRVMRLMDKAFESYETGAAVDFE